MNVSPAVALVVSARLATLRELQTDLGSEDLQDLIEVLAVDSHNQRVLNTPKG